MPHAELIGHGHVSHGGRWWRSVLGAKARGEDHTLDVTHSAVAKLAQNVLRAP